MKALASVVLVFAVCASMLAPSSAADDKQLVNVRGQVGVQSGTATPQELAVGATIAIDNSQYVVTGGTIDGKPSQGRVHLPDSSDVLIGQNTRVQMVSFDNVSNVAKANFILVNGKMRFEVRHPHGAKANYTSSTTTGQIAVRGTVGDISLTPAQLQVNVYDITDPTVPVEVTMNDGKVYKLSAGQTLTIALAGAVIAAGTVAATTQAQQSEFDEFGSPAQAIAAVAAAAAVSGIPAVAAIAAGAVALGGVVVGVGGHGGGGEASPPPSGIHVNPSTLTFTAGTGPLQFTASESGYTGAFQAAIDNPAVATVSGGPAAFTVTPKTNGTASIKVTDTTGHSAAVGVSVQATTIVVPASLPPFTSIGQKQSFTPQETYYVGSFNAASGDKTVATVNASTSSSAGQFTVTSTGPGATQITVTDSLGHSSPVGIAVNARPTPTPTTIPICIGAPRPMHPEHDRMEPNVPHPSPTQTCPPTPMVAPPVILHRVVPPPQPRPVGPQPPGLPPSGLPGHPTPPPMPGNPPQGV